MTKIIKGTAHGIHQKIVEAGRLAQMSFLAIAEGLYQIKSQGLFTELSHDSFNAYLHDAELPFDAKFGHSIVKSYEQMKIRFKIPEATLIEIGQTKAIVIARALERGDYTRDQVDEMINEARTSPVHTLKLMVNERMRGVAEKDCAHNDKAFVRCLNCYRIKYV